jgi:heme-degrading monooxygenase HmoA
MPYILGIAKVEDFDKWKSGFSGPEGVAMRKAAGGKSHQIFHPADDPNTVVVLIEWDNLDNARKYFQSKEFREAQPRAGVIGMPEVHFLEEVEEWSI